MKKIFRFSFSLPLSVGVFSLVIYSNTSRAQNVGIGISNPTRAKLEVHGAMGATNAIFGGESSGISLQSNWPGIGFNQYYNGANKYMANGFAAVQFLDPGIGSLYLNMFPSGVANTTIPNLYPALAINNDGNIGIRTNPVNATLQVIKAGNFDGSAIFGGTQYNSHFHYSNTEDTYIRAGKSGGNVYINDLPSSKIFIGGGTSYVGINTATPVYPLEIRQTGGKGMILVEPQQSYNNWEQVVALYTGGQSCLNLLYNGFIKCLIRPTDGEIIVISDRRLKSNIQPLPLILDKIMQLSAVEFEMKFKNPGHKKSIGFIAQEVKKIFPELVTISSHTVSDGVTIADFHSLNYHSFTMLAVKATQEEQALIINLQNRQSEITGRLEQVEKKLAIKN
jgi:hypothetical protein